MKKIILVLLLLSSFVYANDYAAVKVGGGTGVVIISDEKSYILTCAHVIHNNEIDVVEDGKKYKGVVVGIDKEVDLALIEVNAELLKEREIADSVDIGDEAWFVGYGSKRVMRCFDANILARVGVMNEDGNSNIQFVLDTREVIPGDSGSQLINDDGELVGIVTGHLRKGSKNGIAVELDDVQTFTEACFFKLFKKKPKPPSHPPTKESPPDFIPSPISEIDIRKIIREELANINKQPIVVQSDYMVYVTAMNHEECKETDKLVVDARNKGFTITEVTLKRKDILVTDVPLLYISKEKRGIRGKQDVLAYLNGVLER